MEEGTNAINTQPSETGSNTVVSLTMANEGPVNPVMPNAASTEAPVPPPVTGDGSLPPAEARPPSDPGYSVGTWAGRPNYVCAACPFATLQEEEIQGHVRRHFAAPEAPPVEPTHT